MCGIAGVISKTNKPVVASEVEEMLRPIFHRGPDGKGIYIDKRVGLGHRRLSIIDTLCRELYAIFKIDPGLAERFSDPPAARGQPTATLKTFVKDRAGYDRRCAVDTTKIESELGYKPVHTFETSFANTLEWYLNNESWWPAALDGSYGAWVEKNYGAA